MQVQASSKATVEAPAFVRMQQNSWLSVEDGELEATSDRVRRKVQGPVIP